MVLLGPDTITIDGVDVTALVDASTLQINNEITRAVDTARFMLYDFDGSLAAASFDPLEAELLITDSNGVRLFGGIIKSAEEDTRYFEGEWREAYSIQASDFTDLLFRDLTLDTYESMTDGDIIASAFAEYVPAVDVATYVVDSETTYTRFVANRIRPAELLDRLAEASGYDWYVDPDKKLHYFPSETYSAPFDISDSPDSVTSFAPNDFSYQVDTKDLCNQITIIGGTKRSEDQTYYVDGNGVSTEVLLPYALHAPDGFTSIQVSKNTGTDATPVWTSVGVGIDNIDTLGGSIGVLYNFKEKLLVFQTAPANLNKAVRIIGQRDIPIMVRRSSFASFDRYGDWYADKIVDKDIQDDETARQVARSTLAERAFHKERLSFWTFEHGLRAGQTIHVTDSGKGLDSNYLILSVKTSLLSDEVVKYSVEAGAANPDLVLMLLDIRRRQFREDDDTADAVLTELLVSADTLSLVEDYTITSFTGPYEWGPDAQQFDWGKAKWS